MTKARTPGPGLRSPCICYGALGVTCDVRRLLPAHPDGGQRLHSLPRQRRGPAPRVPDPCAERGLLRGLADDPLKFQQLLADRWATAPAQHTTRDAGELGVRLYCYLDLRQPLDS
ncbi:DUF6207 family protein [Streptomyces purpurascens]|uniref:DUF6207 family protein n=1 Tax=Streptomyces purpurascens TaxID=1924 RepID=UPI003C2F067F